MIDSYQGPDSNQHPLKSLSQITVRFKGYSQIVILSKFSDLWLIYWLGLGYTSVTSLDVNLRMWEIAIDLRIWRWFENLKKDIDLRIWNQRLSRACIVHLVIKKTNWSYVKTMSCSGSHLGITINIKNTTFVKDLPMIDA